MTGAGNTEAAKDWRTVSIETIKAPTDGSIAIGPFGSRMKAETYVAAGVPVVRGSNIGDTRALRGDFVYIPWSLAEAMRSSLLSEGDLFFPHRGAIGEVGIVDDGAPSPCMLSTSVMKLSPDPRKADSRFLFYFFRSTRGRYELLRNASQVGTPGIATPLTSLRQITVRLPPLREQRAIARVLVAVDDKIDSNRRLAGLLEDAAATLFRARFVDFVGMEESDESEIGRMPRGWSAGTIGDIAEQQRQFLRGPSHLPYIGLDLMPRGSTVLTEWMTNDAPTGQSASFATGDILFGKLRPYFRKVGVAPLAGRCSTEILVLRPRAPEMYGVLLGHIASQAFIDHCVAVSRGTRMPRAEWRDAAAFGIAVPPVAVAEDFSEIARTIYTKIRGLTFESRTLASIRDALLPKLTSGEIRVPEAADLTEVVEPVAAALAAGGS